jgi:hypothetical protein
MIDDQKKCAFYTIWYPSMIPLSELECNQHPYYAQSSLHNCNSSGNNIISTTKPSGGRDYIPVGLSPFSSGDSGVGGRTTSVSGLLTFLGRG